MKNDSGINRMAQAASIMLNNSDQEIEQLKQLLSQANRREELLREALNECSELFSEIRGDWSDPRYECRKGQEVIAAALSGEPA